MKKINQLVQFDFERNTFYKINKDTGAESPTYKNGEELKKFRPDITGHHYLMRRKSQRVDVPEMHSKISKQTFNNERQIHQYSYFKTLDTSRRQSKATENSIISMRSTFSNKKKQQPLSPRQSKMNSFYKMEMDLTGGELSKQKSSEKLNKELLNQTLTNYTKLLKSKCRQNNSPKKDEYEGSVSAKDPLDTLCTTLSHFRIRQPIWQKKASMTSRQIDKVKKVDLPSKQSATKQRSIFFNFHPQYQDKVSPKAIQVQVQRKKNLKLLEDLFIRQNNKATRKIYQSIT